jgi:hypothetical protein
MIRLRRSCVILLSGGLNCSEGGKRGIAPKNWVGIFCPGDVDEMCRVEGRSVKLEVLDNDLHELGY